MTSRLLLVEDERDVATILAFNLRAEGFDVTAVETASDAFRQVAAQKFDLVILDLMLPDASGLDVCRRLRSDVQTRETPILIASARGEEVDRIVGLELGAEDYVVKPYSVREVVLRARKLMSRREAGPRAPGTSADTVSFGVLTIDRAAHRVFVEGKEVSLTALELRLLDMLLERKNRTQSRETLLMDVWQLNAAIETRTVDTHVKRLREKLGNAASYIRTVRGIGYRFASSPDEPMGD